MNKKDERLDKDFKWEHYFSKLNHTVNSEITKKDQLEQFGDSFILVNGHKIPLNFKNYVKYHTKLTLSEKNKMVYLHNNGAKDQEYGKRLFKFA